MAADRRRAERIMLPRRFPTHVIGRIVGYLIISGIAAAGVILLFGQEPRRLAGEQINPLAFLPYVLVIALVIGLIPMVTSLFRRPLVSADNYSLTVRPGILRTLVLPWARISELAIYSVTLRDDPEPLLLVRCAEWHSPLGDNPGWWDQRVWRAAAKSAGGAIGGYDVAVRLSEFTGEARAHLDAIGAFAPERVSVVDRTGAQREEKPEGKRAAKPGRRGPRGGAGDAGRSMPPEPGPAEAWRGAQEGPGWRGYGGAEDWQDDPTTDLQGPARTPYSRFQSRRGATSEPPAPEMAPGMPPPGMARAMPPRDAEPGPPPGVAQDPPTELLHLDGVHSEPVPPKTSRRGRRAERREQSRADSGRRGRRGQPPDPATEQFSPAAYLPPAGDFESDQFSPSAYLPPAGDFGAPEPEPTTRPPIGSPGSPGPPGWGAPPHQSPPHEPPPYGAATPLGPAASAWPEEWPPEDVQTDRTQALPPSGQADQYHQPRYPESPYGEPEPYDEPTQGRRPYPPPGRP